VKRLCGAVALVLAFAGLTAAQPNSQGWAGLGVFGNFHVVVPHDATPAEQMAASALKLYWRERTAYELTISAENEGDMNMWVGRSALGVELAARDELEALGPGGFLLRTFTPSRREQEMGARKQLLLTSLTDAGALHAAYEFLDRYLGVRWLAPGVTATPRTAFAINEFELLFRPCFAHRSTGYSALWSMDAAEYLRAHKLDEPAPPEGLATGTFFTLLPPERFFAERPGYYAEIDGRRAAALALAGGETPTQLCCTNQEAAETLIAELLALLRAPADTLDDVQRARRDAVLAQGGERLVVVAPMPWAGACECAECRALEQQENSAAAPLLRLVNSVSERVKEAFPGGGYRVATFCAGVRRRPPAQLRPCQDVVVFLGADGCDMGRPADGAGSLPNAAFARDLKAWSAITPDLRIWNYAGNQENPLRLHPDLHVYRQNGLFYDQYNVSGVHVQARAPGVNAPAEIDALRAYVLAKALWDPDFPWEQARDDFISRYYGPPGAALRGALGLVAERARKSGAYLHPRQDGSWLDSGTAAAALTMLDQALAEAPMGDRRNRLEIARLPFTYAAMTCPPQATADGGRLVLERPSCEDWSVFAGRLRELGPGMEPVIAQCAGASDNGLAPRREEMPLVVLENGRLLVWLAPLLDGRLVRCVDKATGNDLVKNPFGQVPDTLFWREWDFAAGVSGAPAAPRYEVVARDATSAVLRGTTAQGLTLERRIALDVNENALTVVLEISNGTDREAAPAIGLRASFETQALLTPDIRANWNGAWTRLSGEDNPLGPLWNARAHRLSGVRAWNVQAQGEISVTSAFTCSGADAGRPFYCQYDPRHQRVVLDFPPVETLAPGASATVEVRYAVAAEPPATREDKPLWRL